MFLLAGTAEEDRTEAGQGAEPQIPLNVQHLRTLSGPNAFSLVVLRIVSGPLNVFLFFDRAPWVMFRAPVSAQSGSRLKSLGHVLLHTSP